MLPMRSRRKGGKRNMWLPEWYDEHFIHIRPPSLIVFLLPRRLSGHKFQRLIFRIVKSLCSVSAIDSRLAVIGKERDSIVPICYCAALQCYRLASEWIRNKGDGGFCCSGLHCAKRLGESDGFTNRFWSCFQSGELRDAMDFGRRIFRKPLSWTT